MLIEVMKTNNVFSASLKFGATSSVPYKKLFTVCEEKGTICRENGTHINKKTLALELEQNFRKTGRCK